MRSLSFSPGRRRLLKAMLLGAFALPISTAYAAVLKTTEAKPVAKTDSQSTLDNLMAAYNGESNANARYLAFAKKADEEGYGPVASLFRAAAKSEEIHAKSHARVIRGMGAAPAAAIKAPEVKSTRENLETAIKGETYEKETMYPAFLKQARADRNKKAVRSFNFARQVEAGHAKLYKEALDNLSAWKGGPKPFYVCPTCGNTVMTISFKKCPICFTKAEKFMTIK